MVTAAAVALSNRLPILLLPGDTFASRFPDPVLQQVENFNSPIETANDAFKPVSKYFDRITRPEQILGSLPQAIQVMLDPSDCGPATIAMSQDVQGESFDFPEIFFEEKIHEIRRIHPDPSLDQDEFFLSREFFPQKIFQGNQMTLLERLVTLQWLLVHNQMDQASLE